MHVLRGLVSYMVLACACGRSSAPMRATPNASGASAVAGSAGAAIFAGSGGSAGAALIAGAGGSAGAALIAGSGGSAGALAFAGEGGADMTTPEPDSPGLSGCTPYPAAPAPDRLTTSDVYAYALVANAHGLYFASETVIGVMPLAGGAVTPLVQGSFDSSSLVVDDRYVYYTLGDTRDVLRMELDGGDPVTVGRGIGGLQGADAKYLYSQADVMYATPRDGSGSPRSLTQELKYFARVAVNQSDVYFLDYADEDPMITGIVRRVSIEGGEVTTVTELPGYLASSMIIADGFVYVAAGQAAVKVFRVPLGGGDAAVFALGGGGGLAGLAADGKYLYFFDHSAESDELDVTCIKKKPLAGGEPSVVARWQGTYGFALTADSTHLYFSDGSGVMRAPK